MNKYDTFEWVKKVLYSCKTFNQDLACDRLITNFYLMFGDMHLYRELMYLSIENTDNLIL